MSRRKIKNKTPKKQEPQMHVPSAVEIKRKATREEELKLMFDLVKNNRVDPDRVCDPRYITAIARELEWNKTRFTQALVEVKWRIEADYVARRDKELPKDLTNVDQKTLQLLIPTINAIYEYARKYQVKTPRSDAIVKRIEELNEEGKNG